MIVGWTVHEMKPITYRRNVGKGVGKQRGFGLYKGIKYSIFYAIWEMVYSTKYCTIRRMATLFAVLQQGLTD